MEQQRYTGTLKKWNAERGFGFITAADGGQDIFVHITAFARDGRQPTEGEALSFAVEPDRNGKRSAIRVQRPGDAARPAAPPRHDSHRASRSGNSPGWLGRLLSGLLVCALVWYGYGKYTQRAARFDSGVPTSSAPAPAPAPAPEAAPTGLFSPSKLAVPAGFRCDGRNLCSQMTSCHEATLFLQNCPGMKMDGNGDGVPCEQQWCTN